MKRIINYRPICVFALVEAAGLGLSSFLLDSLGGLILCVAAAIISAGVLLLTKLKKYLYIPVAFALGVFLLSGVYGVYNHNKIESSDAEITATISSEIVKHDDYYYFDVENVSVNGEKLKKSATVFVYYLPEERAGDEIKMTGDINSYDFDLGGFFLSAYRRGNYYRIYPDTLTGLGEGKLSATSSIRVKMKRLLYTNADETAASTASALIFGDKSGIDESFYDDVKDSGLAHIFAVSGLHVGILAGVFFFFAKKLKLRGLVKFLFVIIPPIIYAALCGFPASVVRATIMTAVFLAAEVSGRRKDGLNSLALSAIIVLTLFPTDLFSVGFQMSFASVFGLITISPIFNKLLKFLPKSVRGITSASLAVNVTLWPIAAAAFDQVQVLFLLANLIVLPIMPLMYVFTLFICLFALIIPAAAPVLITLNAVLWPIKAASFIIGSLSLSSVSAAGIGFAALAYYFVVLLSTRLIFIDKRTKGKISLTAAALGICLLLI